MTDGHVFHPSGRQEWWDRGELHRFDGPAVIHPDGREEWRVEGILHRLDGPAVTQDTCAFEWFVHHQDVTAEMVEWCDTNGIPRDLCLWDDTQRVLVVLKLSTFD